MSAGLLDNTAVLTGRTLKHVTRSPDTIITTALMPVALMLLFVYVLGGAIAGSMSTAEYVTYMLPGILVMTISMGVSYTGARMFSDASEGIFARFQSMPISRSSALWAHVVTSIVGCAVSVLLVIGVALLAGFRSSAGVLDWLAVAGILTLLTLTLTWVAVIAGLTAKSVEGAAAFSYPLILLPFISSAFVPTDTMPGAVRWFAENQPATSMVDSMRALLAEQPVGSEIWVALAWCIGILAIAYIVAMRIYRRKFT